ncbi:glycosyltransferase family 2 protein [Cyclobacterium xiamenense]|jgi:glycosyltransferase involved in cell wall biosynthesis|uniref:glycosyltransferase family 2 protein n=1 Tax=Cyclobacterium xiamenense TaxID=1297121 RepID=UPI0035CF155E
MSGNLSEEEPLVSVCVISYNHEKFIETALAGILRQRVAFNVQLVISDDCSSDQTPQLIQKMSENLDSKVAVEVYCQSKNLGVIGNFMFALKKCTGKYIAICEGDDFWTDEEKLALQAALLEENPELAGSFHKVKVRYEGKPYLTGEYGRGVPSILTTKDLISEKSLMHTSSLFFRREALVFPDWYPTMLSGDFALASILSAYGAFSRIDRYMSTYRVHETGITNSHAYNRDNIDLKIRIVTHLNEFHDFRYAHEFESLIEELRSKKERKTGFVKALRRRLKIGLLVKRLRYWLHQV